MPVFHRPRTVVVSDDGGGGLAAIAALIALAVVVSSAAAVIADVLDAILIVLGVLAVAGTGVLVLVLRRSRLAAWRPPAAARATMPAPPAWTAQAISAPRRLAIEAPQPDYGITGSAREPIAERPAS